MMGKDNPCYITWLEKITSLDEASVCAMLLMMIIQKMPAEEAYRAAKPLQRRDEMKTFELKREVTAEAINERLKHKYGGYADDFVREDIQFLLDELETAVAHTRRMVHAENSGECDEMDGLRVWHG